MPSGTDVRPPGQAALNSASSASAADPRLNSEPAARDDRAQHRGDVAPLHSKARPAKNGNEMPYFVPACAFRIIGISTMTLPRRIVTSA